MVDSEEEGRFGFPGHPASNLKLIHGFLEIHDLMAAKIRSAPGVLRNVTPKSIAPYVFRHQELRRAECCS